jgi:hypothetical protein
VTVPAMFPVVTCAMSDAGAMRLANAANTTANLFKLVMDPPEGLLKAFLSLCGRFYHENGRPRGGRFVETR